MRWSFTILLLLSCQFVVNQITSQEIGVSCRTREGRLGRCVSIENCEPNRKIRPRFCGYNDYDELFCCSNSKRNNRNRVNINSRNSVSKSQQKCQEYSSTISKTSTDYDYFNPWGSFRSSNAIVSGQNSFPREFPHMAALGFGDEQDIKWNCGGSLISENFILTAAHCLSTREFGAVKFVRLGDLDLDSNNEDSEPQQYKVKKTYEYPDYKTDSRYHDIGLIEIESSARFSRYVQPACLHTSTEIPPGKLTATGWGSQVYAGSPVSFLQKVELRYTPFQQCKDTYRPENELENGIVDEWQICAGGNDRGDTCQGDSGSPLQYKSLEESLFSIIGVVSFGKLCGLAPGVYSRVSFYVPWIEKIVWAN